MVQLDHHIDNGGILDHTLNRHLDELVETVELLAEETLLVEVGVDDDPTGFLP
jgi:hypothetical protein